MGQSRTSFSLPMMLVLIGSFALIPLAEAGGHAVNTAAASTCAQIKTIYKDAGCCGAPTKVSGWQVVPMPSTMLNSGTNICAGQKPKIAYFDNVDCLTNGVANALEQSGTNVTKGYKGMIDTSTPARPPIREPYWKAGLCPVNVHWHLGTEHLSVGQYDENGKAPSHRRLSAGARKGFSCHHYNANDAKFTTEYAWQHCKNMKVGETYEVHWPHSVAGACGSPNQYQSPFYDGVFCNGGIISLDPLNTFSSVGVQGQIFTIVNDENFYYPDLMRGMIVDGAMGTDIASYTGSTTGTSRSNTICSKYTPITWQVDRKCHMISASSFDKMCADMKAQRDDMTSDLEPHGARELVADKFAADNHQRL